MSLKLEKVIKQTNWWNISFYKCTLRERKYIEDIALRREHMKFIFEWKIDFTRSLRSLVQINFICSNQRTIFFLLHRYECFENYKKRDEKQRKNKGISLATYSLVRIWKISHSYPGCSFVWKIRVVYFSVKHSYLCNKNIYQSSKLYTKNL